MPGVAAKEFHFDPDWPTAGTDTRVILTPNFVWFPIETSPVLLPVLFDVIWRLLNG